MIQVKTFSLPGQEAEANEFPEVAQAGRSGAFQHEHDRCLPRQRRQLTEKIIKVLDGSKGGIAGHGVELTLGNYLIQNGVVGYVMKAIRERVAIATIISPASTSNLGGPSCIGDLAD